MLDLTEFSRGTALAMIDYILAGNLNTNSVDIAELSRLACQLQVKSRRIA